MHSAEPRTDVDVFELTRDELDALPFGVITLSRSGKILRYNRFEEGLARRSPQTTVGLDFFNEVAPCTNVAAFRGRFDEFTRGRDSGSEHFDFVFGFRWGRQDVEITLLRKAAHDEINVLVHPRAEGKVFPFERRQRRDAVRPERSLPGHAVREFGASGPQPTVVRVGDLEEAHLRSRIHIDDVAAVRRVVSTAALARVPYSTEYRIMRLDNSIGVVVETGFFPTELGAPGYATIVDVSARRTSEEDNWRAAHFDGLTNLPNHRFFLQRIATAVEEARVNDRLAAVLVANVDRFRESNAMFGPDICNALLTGLALRLGECVRAGDSVARLGDDVFAILLTDVGTRANIAEIARRLTATIAQPFVFGARAQYLTLSVGISVTPDDAGDPDALLRAAYTATSAAHVDGQSGVRWYGREMSNEAAHTARLRDELRAGVENNELTLLYQPIVDLGQNRIVAVESLVCWNHPTRGLLAQADLVGLADGSRLTLALDAWVLREACRQARAWHDLGFALRVCVNVCAVQFREPGFVGLIADVLAEAGLASNLLELELTESVMADGSGGLAETLGRLKALGVRLAIDDVGAGYGSLAYLKYFPIDTLKIDRAFVVDIAVDDFDRAIAAAVLGLAKERGLECVVDGIESREQIDVLCGLGCTLMQGDYFSRPVTAELLTGVLRGSLNLNPLPFIVAAGPAT